MRSLLPGVLQVLLFHFKYDNNVFFSLLAQRQYITHRTVTQSVLFIVLWYNFPGHEKKERECVYLRACVCVCVCVCGYISTSLSMPVSMSVFLCMSM